MKKTILAIGLLVSVSAFSQKQDSLVLKIEIDTTTFKNIVALIQENINGNTTTGKLLLQNILAPFYQNLKLVPRERVIADKPKEAKKINP